jgi:alanine racemase
MNYSIDEIKNIIKGKFSQKEGNTFIAHVCIDTRQITQPTHSLFFCLIARNNGHQYIETAYKKGIRCFIVSQEINTDKFSDATFILVENTTVALQQLAKFHREQFSIPVVGITGSNGKTIVKEWLYQLLSTEKNIVKSPKSYNSQIGVPISVLNMVKENELAIFEAGISSKNEMQNLQQIIQPTIGIFTTIGTAHDAGFSSLEEKVKEKLELFKNCKKVIYSSTYKEIREQIKENNTFISFGTLDNDNYKLSNKKQTQNDTQIFINNIPFHIPFADDASVENCLHCIVLLKELGYTDDFIQKRMDTLRNLPMRLELKYGINNCTIIDDSYSADFHSLQIALDFLKQQESNKKKTLIISEFEESGLDEKSFIKKLKEVLQLNSFDKLIGVGKAFMHHIESLAYVVKEWYVFESTEQLIAQFNVLKFENELILLKGARRFYFEKITAQLIGQTHATVLEINLNALVNNLNIYKKHLPKNTGVIAMVKAFSYGSGSTEIASLLEKQHISYLAVAYADEGVELRREGIQTPIMVMNPDAVDFDRMLQYQLEPEIYSLHILQQLIQKAGNQTVSIHIKLETGMNRLGFVENELEELISLLQLHKNIVVKTTFSHLAASEDKTLDSFTIEQINTFEKLSSILISTLNYPIKKHILNSSGILRFPQAHYDFVRLGIGLYGVDSANQIQKELLPIGKLKTRIAQIKIVPQGQTVGYSRKGKADKDLKIAILAIGYADGYDRRMGNGMGEVFIAGQRAHIIGNICMDMCMADITHIDNVADGDECEIYGKEISIIEAAKKIGTIPYELLTRISSRVKRLYYLD